MTGLRQQDKIPIQLAVAQFAVAQRTPGCVLAECPCRELFLDALLLVLRRWPQIGLNPAGTRGV